MAGRASILTVATSAVMRRSAGMEKPRRQRAGATSGGWRRDWFAGGETAGQGRGVLQGMASIESNGVGSRIPTAVESTCGCGWAGHQDAVRLPTPELEVRFVLDQVLSKVRTRRISQDHFLLSLRLRRRRLDHRGYGRKLRYNVQAAMDHRIGFRPRGSARLGEIMAIAGFTG